MKTLISLLMFFSLSLYADEYLIQEMEDLYLSLSVDDPAKTQLSLRLADLYFDVSIKDSDSPKVFDQRTRSLELYQEALGKNDKGLHATKVKFQMARLLLKLNQEQNAIKYFEQVYNESENDKNLKREASFQLAQWYENQAKFELTNKYFTEAIKLCNSVDSCNYAHYRRAWLLYKETKLDDAIEDLKLSLWDSKGQIREKVLNDYVMFLSNKETDGSRELIEFEKLAKKINNPNIIRQLGEGYFTSGNRIAGTKFLEYLNKKNSKLYYEVRLLEEYYGHANWVEVNRYLSYLKNRTSNDMLIENDSAQEIVKVLRRFIVQLDAETQQSNQKSKELLSSIEIYLTLIPNDELRSKMQEGWLKVQIDEEKKLVQLATWIEESIKLQHQNEQIRKLRQTRLSIAQKLKKSQIVISEALEIAKNVDLNASREFNYIAARQMYEEKQYDLALPIFLKLSNEALKAKQIDQWSILAQNLALDIYNTQKKYDLIIAQANLWINGDIEKNEKLSKEIFQMQQIASQATFEKAVLLGKNKEALNIFYQFCFEKRFEAKACENAKVLSVELKDQTKLVALLERESNENALINEYELMGEFSKAAKLKEKIELKKSEDYKIYLKTALLYELGQDFSNRDRILKKLIKKIENASEVDREIENLLFITLEEAGLLDVTSLRIKWSLPLKLKLAHRLEMNSPNNITQKILLTQKNSVGPAWSKLVLSKIIPLDMSQRKISFYGRDSKRKFEKRTKAIEKFSLEIKERLEGADTETRIYLLNIAKLAYSDFSNEILNTPLPNDLDEQTLGQVKEQLNQMAQPFLEVSKDYHRLQIEQRALLNDSNDKNRIENNLNVVNPDYLSFFETKKYETIDVSKFDYSPFKEMTIALHANPENLEILKKYEEFYKQHQSMRMSSYFSERINSIKN